MKTNITADEIVKFAEAGGYKLWFADGKHGEAISSGCVVYSAGGIYSKTGKVTRFRGEVIEGGCEPHVQPEILLNALKREPIVRFDWTAQQLADVARWANGWVWKKVPFAEYDRSRRN